MALRVWNGRSLRRSRFASQTDPTPAPSAATALRRPKPVEPLSWTCSATTGRKAMWGKPISTTPNDTASRCTRSGRERTNRRPSAMSPNALRPDGLDGAPRGRPASRTTLRAPSTPDAKNTPASPKKATPIRAPAAAGPATRASCTVDIDKKMALVMASRPTISEMNESRAGARIEIAPPCTTLAASSIQ